MTLIPKDNIKHLDPRSYTLPLQNHAWLRNEFKNFEKADIMLPSTSIFSSPIIIVAKKKDISTHEVTYRMVVDFKKIAEQLKYQSYPLMGIDRIFSKLHAAKLFSTLNVRVSYYNITVAKGSPKYATVTTECAKYKFLHVPFGIHVALKLFHHDD